MRVVIRRASDNGSVQSHQGTCTYGTRSTMEVTGDKTNKVFAARAKATDFPVNRAYRVNFKLKYSHQPTAADGTLDVEGIRYNLASSTSHYLEYWVIAEITEITEPGGPIVGRATGHCLYASPNA